jgi:hypothetical protein
LVEQDKAELGRDASMPDEEDRETDYDLTPTSLSNIEPRRRHWGGQDAEGVKRGDARTPAATVCKDTC